MRKLKLFMMACALLGAGQVWATQINWTSKTNLITNPSFETDEAIADLKSSAWSTTGVTGWTITPASASNSQIGIANSSSALQGIGDNFSPSDGEKFFYTRNNWNANTVFTLSQTITAGENLPSGLYKLTCKAASFSSNAAFNTFTLSLQEGTNAAIAHSGIVLNVWNTWGVIIFKEAGNTNLTITMTLKPGYDGGSKHYAVLLDDFQLEYISAEDAYSASASNTIDFSDIINNAGIYNHSTAETLPRGWASNKHTTGNNKYTSGTGDTKLEGWSNSAVDIDYYQQLTNLPVGSYTITATAYERANDGKTFIYGYTEGQDKAQAAAPSTEGDVTTTALKVTNGTMNIGIESKTSDWATADNFRVSFLGFDVDAIKANLTTALSEASSALTNDDYVNVTGTEKTALQNAITTYTTDETMTYGWYSSALAAINAAKDAFTGAKTSYDAFVAEKTYAEGLGVTVTTPTPTSVAGVNDAINAIKVEEYNYVTSTYTTDGSALFIPSWDKTNFGAETSQHWSGENREYYDKWNGSSFTSSISKTVTLPEGHYVFYAAGRGQATAASSVTLKVTIGKDTHTASYAMRGDTGYGIDTDGNANYSAGGTYANNNAGRGWEWRYLKFDLAAETEVTLMIEGKGNNSWVSACDTRLVTYNNIKVSKDRYDTAKANAEAALTNDDYVNITGSERTDLSNVIANNANPTQTYEGYDAAAAALEAALPLFTATKASYDAFNNAKTADYENNLSYASATKFAAIATAQAATAATSEADAIAKTNAILAAYRKYVESNALAEGMDGAEDKTNLITDPNMEVTYDGTAHTFGAWQVIEQTNGSIQLLTSQSFTDGDGKNNYKYADIYKNDNNAGIQQFINLEPGRYLLTVTARANNTAGAAFWVFAGDKTADISRIGNSGGVFDRGWNDASLEFCIDQTKDVKIGVQSGNGKDLWWSATRFRLVKLPTAADAISETVTYAPEAKFANVTLTRTFSANVWNTFVVPFNIDNATLKAQFGNEVQVAEVKAADLSNTSVKFTSMETPAITANQPVIIKGATQKASYSFNNVFIKTGEAKVQGTNAAFIGNYTGELTLDAGSIYIASNKLKSATGTQKIKGTRAYFTITSGDASRMVFTIDGQETTAIEGISTVTEKDGKMYNLNGQEVKNAQKGLYIKNGKKVVIK